jgi:uncharacterized protein
MADWSRLSSRGNVQDRRSNRSALALGGGGLGLTGLALVVLFTYLGGGDIGDVANQLQNIQVQEQYVEDSGAFAGDDAYEVFASTVLGSNNDMWTKVFAESNMPYTSPTLVLFRDMTESSCGGASARVGPHYCQLDQTIYLDETFFDALQSQFGAGSADVAQAYVIAHEVGHHVQNQLGLLQNPSAASPDANEVSIKQELQADCFAGLWAYSIKDLGVLEFGEIQEAMDAAAAVGDDRIQEATTGRVNPESWTHGSSADRITAFDRGYTTGNVSSCVSS